MVRVIALCGGGMLGRAQAAALALLEQKVGKSVAEMGDLFVGTSTGALAALLYSLGHSAEEAEKFYDTLGPRIFGRKRWHHPLGLFGGMYSIEVLQDTLREAYHGASLYDARKPVMVCVTDALSEEPDYFKSWRADLGHDTLPMHLVGSASAAAPKYFDRCEIPPYAQFEGGYYCDGGLSQNNPSLAALVQIKRGQDPFPQASMDDAWVLSVGVPAAVSKSISSNASLFFLPHLLSSTMGGSMKLASAMCRALIDMRFVELEGGYEGANCALDDASPLQLERLAKAGRSMYRAHEHRLLVWLNG